MQVHNIGFGTNAGVIVEQENDVKETFFVMGDFFKTLTPSVLQDNMGTAGFNTMVLTVVTILLGLFIITALSKKGVTGSVLFSILGASVIYWAGSFLFLLKFFLVV